MNRIQAAFQSEKKTRLIPFIVTGDPSLEVTIDLIELLDQEQVALIELGVPFSDPIADGPVIQAAADRALAQGITIKDVLEVGHKARQRGVRVPLVLFSYYNPLLQYGLSALMRDARTAGFDGMIVPDLPLEESQPLKQMAEENQLSLIPLVAPTSRQRIADIVAKADAFVYCVSSLGTTGMRSHFAKEVESFLTEVKALSPVPIVVGFGISKPEHVQYLHTFTDGVVVGSALVHMIAEKREQLLSPTTRNVALEEIRLWIRQLLFR